MKHEGPGRARRAPPALLEGQLGPAAAPELQVAALSARVEEEPSTLFRAKGMQESVVRHSTGPARDALRALLESLGGAVPQLPA